eukprot:GEMP01059671.1.p1 GENE.GEMP01059671.1~~GEMP01059671.1.p1  ORF type:complete len:330 (+),score=60.40 GEMP01059671.1:43-1032(+)
MAQMSDGFALDLKELRLREQTWAAERKTFSRYAKYRFEILAGIEQLAQEMNYANEPTYDKPVDRILYVAFRLWENALAHSHCAGEFTLRHQLIWALAAFLVAVRYEYSFDVNLQWLPLAAVLCFDEPFSTLETPTWDEIGEAATSIWQWNAPCLSRGVPYPMDFLVIYHAILQGQFEKAEKTCEAIMDSHRADTTLILLYAASRCEIFSTSPPSLLAAATVYATCLVPRWPKELQEASGHSCDQVRRVALEMHRVTDARFSCTPRARFLPPALGAQLRKRRTPNCTTACVHGNKRSKHNHRANPYPLAKKIQTFQPTMACFLTKSHIHT